MGTIWFDETPYPGPHDDSIDWKKLQIEWRRAWGKGASAVVSGFSTYLDGFTEAYFKMGSEAKATTEAFGIITPPDRSDKRAWGLHQRQNRNTGPTPEWGFHRNGRRTS